MDKQIISNDTFLQYKDHKDFFDKYYELRDQTNDALSEFILDKNKAKDTLKLILKLINWVNNYVKDLESLRKEYFEIVKYYQETKLFDEEEKEKFFEDVHKLWDKISDENKVFELLPKPQEHLEDEAEIDKFWKSEEIPKLREAKKAFSDMLKNYM